MVVYFLNLIFLQAACFWFCKVNKIPVPATLRYIYPGSFSFLYSVVRFKYCISLRRMTLSWFISFCTVNRARRRFDFVRIVKYPYQPRFEICSRIIANNFSCAQCSFVYYGQTERPLKTRIAENRKVVSRFDHNSNVAAHVHQSNHNMDFENVEVVGLEVNYHEGVFLGAWHSTEDLNTLTFCGEQDIGKHFQLYKTYSYTFFLPL